MLGEGFDHPKLSVAAIFRPFRTLAPYIQFVEEFLGLSCKTIPLTPTTTGTLLLMWD